MGTSHQHPLFARFPLDGERQVSTGRVPTPYHIYEGHGLLIGGTADLNAVTNLLKTEQIYPVQTQAGRALMTIWVCDFTEASLGPHNELQFSIVSAYRAMPSLENHPLALLKAIFTNPDLRLLCHGLWNNTAPVLAYNREFLGLNARLNVGRLERKEGYKTFSFHDEAGAPIFQGNVREVRRTPFREMAEMFKVFGLRQMMKALSEPYLGTHVVNTLGEVFPYHTDALACIVASPPPVLQFFDPQTDSLTFGQELYSALDFTPLFLEHFDPFRFVYLNPQKANSE